MADDFAMIRYGRDRRKIQFYSPPDVQRVQLSYDEVCAVLQAGGTIHSFHHGRMGYFRVFRANGDNVGTIRNAVFVRLWWMYGIRSTGPAVFGWTEWVKAPSAPVNFNWRRRRRGAEVQHDDTVS